jgi:hypothetical protein
MKYSPEVCTLELKAPYSMIDLMKTVDNGTRAEEPSAHVPK